LYEIAVPVLGEGNAKGALQMAVEMALIAEAVLDCSLSKRCV
jgi:hypothetical protein